MSGFGQAPVFGAQSLAANTISQASSTSSPSPFGALPNPTQHPSPSTFAQSSHQSQPPAFGSPSSFPTNSFQQTHQVSAFGAPNNGNGTNAFGAPSSSPSAGGMLAGHHIASKEAPMSNPFAPATAAPLGAASNPFATQTQAQASTAPATSNPFASAIPSATTQNASTAANPFAPADVSSPFTTLSNSTSGALATAFGQPSQPSTRTSTPFANAPSNAQKRKNAFDDKTGSKKWGTAPDANATYQTTSSFATADASAGFGGQGAGSNSNGFAGQVPKKETNGFAGSIAAVPVQSAIIKGQKKSPYIYAKEIKDQLLKEKLRPPPWPKNPGDPNNIKEMDDYRVKFKKYESKVRETLIKAGFIDDPNVRKKLSDAIDFRGICEDMCPEGEKVSRIVEHDVKLPERVRSDGPDNGFANPDLMVKSFKRSAAGMDSPLPTEVRSPAALRRTLDYLIDDVLRGDENLPVMHGFLWDRTRAIRKDFIFQNAMSPEERMDQIYCLENITRFHAVSLHLLSRDGKDDFSEQQEREQLGKTLLSLIQVYDECKDMSLKLDNEAEFRAYYLLFNAHDPFVIQQMQDWNDRFWSDSPEIQTVVTLIEVMRNTWAGRGPLRPVVPLTTGSASFTVYFSIVQDPKVSYTMACLAEIHFTEIRRLILKSIHRAHGRVRDGPKDLTAKVLNEMFRFDTDEECVAFLKDLDMEFSSEGATEPYLIVERRRSLPAKTIKQSFSQAMVERKRGEHSLPEVVHSTVLEDAASTVKTIESPNGLFVTQPRDTSVFSEPKPSSMEFSFSDDDSPSSSPAPPRQGLAPPPTSSSTTGLPFPQETPKAVPDAIPKNPFASQQSTSTTTPMFDKPALTSQVSPFPWTTNAPSSNAVQNPPPPEQPPQEIAKFPWSSSKASTPAAPTPPAPVGGNIFGFLQKPSEEPGAPLFPATPGTVPGLSTTSSFFTNPQPMHEQDKAGVTPPSTEATVAKATVQSDKTEAGPSAVTAIFSAPAPSAPAATTSLFTSAAPSFTPPATKPPEATKPSSSADISTFALDQSSVTAAVPVQAPPVPQLQAQPADLMGNLARWVLLGDDGMMEQLQDVLVEKVVRETYENFMQDERDRKRREEDDKSWAAARKFRKYSLRVKFFYRWRENARRRALKRVGHQNRTKLKAYREAKAAEARAASKKKEKEEQARLKRLTAPSSWLDELQKDRAVKRARRSSMSLDTSRRSSPASDADALLTTGLFEGIRNQQDVAADGVRDDDSIYDALVGVHISPGSKRGVMGPPAKPNRDPLRSVRDAGISKPVPKQKWSKKGQALADLLSGKGKEDDLISFRSSTSSRLGQSERSLPAGGKMTNFTKYQSASPRSSAEPDRPKKGPSRGLKTPYWLLRSHGLFATPMGHVLSDKAPRPRTGSFHDAASRYSGGSENGDYDDRVLEQDGAYRASMGLTGTASRRSTFSAGAAGSPPRPGFMKPNSTSFRQSLPASGLSGPMLAGSPRRDVDAISQTGSAMSTMQQDVEETLRELRKVAAEMEEDTNWYREQNMQLSQGHGSGG